MTDPTRPDHDPETDTVVTPTPSAMPPAPERTPPTPTPVAALPGLVYQTDDGLWHLTLFIENGRIADRGPARHLSGLRAIAESHTGEFRLTPNQNLVVAGVAREHRQAVDRDRTDERRAPGRGRDDVDGR